MRERKSDLAPYYSLTIGIPAYNDKDSLDIMVVELADFLNDSAVQADILIVNDGSVDGTDRTIQRLQARYPFVRSITHTKNAGFGLTLKDVFSAPKTEWVFFLPGDNQFPAANLSIILPLMDRYDYIIGYRKFRDDPFYRRVYSKFYNLILRITLDVEVKDVNSIVAFKRKFIEGYIWKSNSAFVHAELYLRMKQLGASIYETEVIHQAREFGFGSGGNLRVIFATIYDLGRYFLSTKKW